MNQALNGTLLQHSCVPGTQRAGQWAVHCPEKGTVFSRCNSHTQKEFSGTGPAKGTCWEDRNLFVHSRKDVRGRRSNKKCFCKASWREAVSKATNSFWRTQYIKNIDEWTSPHSPDISELQEGSWVDTAHCSVSFYFALLFSIEFITTAIQWLLPLQSNGVSNSDVQGLYVSGWMLWDVKSWQENHKKRTVWVVAWSLRQNKCLFLGNNVEEIKKTHILGWHKPQIMRYKTT